MNSHCYDSFLIRTPILGFYENYKEVNKHIILEAIQHSSYNYYVSLVQNDKLSSDNFESIKKYEKRMRTRCAPFGIMSGIGVGYFGDKTNIVIDDVKKHQKKVEIDAGFLYPVIRNIEKNLTLDSAVSFKWNNSYFYNSDYIVQGYLCRFGEKTGVNKSEIRYTKAVVFIKEMTQNYCSYNDLVNALQKKYPQQSIESCCKFINELIENELLISILRPPVNSNKKFHYFIDKLRIYDLKSFRKLQFLDTLLDSYEESNIGESLEFGDKLIEALLSFSETQDNSYNLLKVDTIMTFRDCLISYKIKTKLNSFAEFLFSLNTGFVNTHLKEYKNKFIEKYGHNKLVNVLELVDEDLGIGNPFSSKLRNGYSNNLKNMLLKELCSNHTDKKCINIKNMKLDTLNNSYPSSLELAVRIAQKENKEEIVLTNLFGSDQGCRIWGRFLEYFGDSASLKEYFSDQVKAFGDDVELCEIREKYRIDRLNNVTNTKSYYKYNILIAFVNRKVYHFTNQNMYHL